jgi:AcrR family transcriptional regulator
MTENIEKKIRKSDRTRAAIEAAARNLFAEHGYDRTTVREIAAAASIDPAMVIRYYGGKDRLFAEIAVFDLGLPDVTKIDQSKIGETISSPCGKVRSLTVVYPCY